MQPRYHLKVYVPPFERCLQCASSLITREDIQPGMNSAFSWRPRHDDSEGLKLRSAAVFMADARSGHFDMRSLPESRETSLCPSTNNPNPSTFDLNLLALS